MSARRWDVPDLTHASGLHRQVINRLVYDERKRLKMEPRQTTVTGLAKAFGVSENHIRLVARQAMGELPDDIDLTVIHGVKEATNDELLMELAGRLGVQMLEKRPPPGVAKRTVTKPLPKAGRTKRQTREA